MSNRLTEEAMAYFDECVSLSTFDSSDFSASEDPPYSLVGSSGPVGTSYLANGSPSTLGCYSNGSLVDHNQVPLFTKIWLNFFMPGNSVVHSHSP